MTARELFGVALRIIAIWIIWLGLYDFLFVLMKAEGIPVTSKLPIEEDIIGGLFHWIMGGILLISTDQIVRIFYKPQKVKTDHLLDRTESLPSNDS